MTQQRKWPWRFSAAPNRWTKLTAPKRASGAAPGTGLLQVTLDHTQEDLEHRAEGLGFAL